MFERQINLYLITRHILCSFILIQLFPQSCSPPAIVFFPSLLSLTFITAGQASRRGKMPTSYLFGDRFDYNGSFFISVKRHSKSESHFQIKRKRGSMGRMCVCVGGGGCLLISYLWICLDTRECFCADFKHYLILQTSLLMLPRSEADCSAACQMKIGALALCA